MKVRVNAKYVYVAAGMDRSSPCQGNTLKPGQLVQVINLPLAPKANTFGQCYVADPKSGEFLCMVSTCSLISPKAYAEQA